MSDLIERQEAIDYCYQLINVEHQQGSDEMNYGYERVNQTETILHHLENMPPAQPERKRGKWIDYTDEGYVECPFCHSATNCDGNKDELHFCFSCGADMRGEQE